VQARIFFFGVLDRGMQNFIFGEAAVPYRQTYSREVLVDNFPGAQSEVPDLGISFLAPGEPDRDAGGLQRPGREVVFNPVHCLQVRDINRIGSVLSPQPPSVQYHHYNRPSRHRLILLSS